MELEPIGHGYLRLALQIEQHFAGFVDAYYGPPEIKAQIEAEGRLEVGRLRDEAAALQAAISQADLDDQRREYLRQQLQAMRTVLRRLAGEVLPFGEEVAGCFAISPDRTDESEFEAIQRTLETLLPGRGDLAARFEAWNRQFILPKDRILLVAQIALDEVRRRTRQLFDLPAGEDAFLQLVSDQPWGAYNWYLGNYRSRIDVNTDTPNYVRNIPDMIAHELYPGHHTEHALKERRWYRQAGRLEASLQLLIAPEALISEAIATTALEAIFPDRVELADWLQQTLFPAADLKADAQQVLEISRAVSGLQAVYGNAAFQLHEDGRSPEEVVEYMRHYALRTEVEAQRMLRFISDLQFRTYVFNYFYGEKLLKQAGEKIGFSVAFRRALTEQITPSTLVN
jgi:hypothetical protein